VIEECYVLHPFGRRHPSPTELDHDFCTASLRARGG
jgi:hypothetical protein